MATGSIWAKVLANVIALLYAMGFDMASIHALFWVCVIGVPLVIILCATGHDGSKDKPGK